MDGTQRWGHRAGRGQRQGQGQGAMQDSPGERLQEQEQGRMECEQHCWPSLCLLWLPGKALLPGHEDLVIPALPAGFRARQVFVSLE